MEHSLIFGFVDCTKWINNNEQKTTGLLIIILTPNLTPTKASSTLLPRPWLTCSTDVMCHGDMGHGSLATWPGQLCAGAQSAVITDQSNWFVCLFCNNQQPVDPSPCTIPATHYSSHFYPFPQLLLVQVRFWVVPVIYLQWFVKLNAWLWNCWMLNSTARFLMSE